MERMQKPELNNGKNDFLNGFLQAKQEFPELTDHDVIGYMIINVRPRLFFYYNTSFSLLSSNDTNHTLCLHISTASSLLHTTIIYSSPCLPFPKLTTSGPRRRRYPRHRHQSHLLPHPQEPRRKSQTRRRTARRQAPLPRLLQEPRSTPLLKRVYIRRPKNPSRYRPHSRTRGACVRLCAAGWDCASAWCEYPSFSLFIFYPSSLSPLLL